ncbi:hypothetical protein [Xylanimonas allomyrinae]|uniref:hypothetical protein n=1 Tax=Xylanimonas allomyrinae TaxID=2509459 RepID=UPI001FEA5557|nr:hypothetical protein [Xylanimonas allomyrinae]
MATQRPAGVIKDNLRANTNLRVALRMADTSDSTDVVEVPDAALVDPSIPGRGLVKTGPGRVQAFQSGYAGGWSTRAPEKAKVLVSEFDFGRETPWEEPTEDADADDQDDLGPNDQQRLVARIGEAFTGAGLPVPRRPWLDSLADVYDLTLLRQRTDTELLIGVADLPEQTLAMPKGGVEGEATITVTLRSVEVAGDTMEVLWAFRWDEDGAPPTSKLTFYDMGLSAVTSVIDGENLRVYRPFCTKGGWDARPFDQAMCSNSQIAAPRSNTDPEFPIHGVIEAWALLPAPPERPETVDVVPAEGIPPFGGVEVTYRDAAK